MNVSLLIEVHQYYINSLKEKIQELEKKQVMQKKTLVKQEPKDIIKISAPKLSPTVIDATISEEEVTAVSAKQVSCIAAKTVTLEISQTSCINYGNFEIYDENGRKLENVPGVLIPVAGGTLSQIQYIFSKEVSISRIEITRPLCTNMLNSKIKLFDSNNNCKYQSTAITQPDSMRYSYMYTMPNPDPLVAESVVNP